MIDLNNEPLISLNQAARMLPPRRLGRPVHPSTILRWITKGVRLPGGDVVRLDGYRSSSSWVTSVAAIGRFLARQTPTLDKSADPSGSPTLHQRAVRQAEEKLREIGI